MKDYKRIEWQDTEGQNIKIYLEYHEALDATRDVRFCTRGEIIEVLNRRREFQEKAVFPSRGETGYLAIDRKMGEVLNILGKRGFIEIEKYENLSKDELDKCDQVALEKEIKFLRKNEVLDAARQRIEEHNMPLYRKISDYDHSKDKKYPGNGLREGIWKIFEEILNPAD